CNTSSTDVCGDLDQDDGTNLKNLPSLTIKCQDSNGDGFADVGTCTTWDNNAGQDCTNASETIPDNKAKCRCEAVRIGDITVCGNGTLESGEQCDQGAANGTSSSCCTSSCTLKSSGTECRAAAGECDAAESCTGSSATCPTDTKKPNLTACTDD